MAQSIYALTTEQAIKGNALVLGNARASHLYNMSVKNTFTCDVFLTQEQQEYIRSNTTTAISFTNTDSVASGHPVLYACRKIVKDLLVQKLGHINVETLFVGAAISEIELFCKYNAAKFYIHGTEAKDYDRIIIPMLQNMANIIDKKIGAHTGGRNLNKHYKRNKHIRPAEFTIDKGINIEARGTVDSGHLQKRLNHFNDVLEYYAKYKGLTQNVFPMELDKVKASRLVFFDSIYNYNENKIHKIFSTTGAHMAVGYACLPLELIFDADCSDGHYIYTHKINRPGDMKHEVKQYSALHFADGNQGYMHKTRNWSTLMRTAGFERDGFHYTIELNFRVGVMATFTIAKCINPNTFIRTIKVPDMYRWVEIADLFGSVRKELGANNMGRTTHQWKYFRVRESEYLTALEYMHTLDPTNMTKATATQMLRRRTHGVQLAMTNGIVPWNLKGDDLLNLSGSIALIAMHQSKLMDAIVGGNKWDKAANGIMSVIADTLMKPLDWIRKIFTTKSMWENLVKRPEESIYMRTLYYFPEHDKPKPVRLYGATSVHITPTNHVDVLEDEETVNLDVDVTEALDDTLTEVTPDVTTEFNNNFGGDIVDDNIETDDDEEDDNDSDEDSTVSTTDTNIDVEVENIDPEYVDADVAATIHAEIPTAPQIDEDILEGLALEPTAPPDTAENSEVFPQSDEYNYKYISDINDYLRENIKRQWCDIKYPENNRLILELSRESMPTLDIKEVAMLVSALRNSNIIDIITSEESDFSKISINKDKQRGRKLFKDFPPRLAGTNKVLDFGSGDGAMCKYIQDKYSHLGITTNTCDNYMPADYKDVDEIPEYTYDYINCRMVLHHCDYKTIIPKLINKLKAGGSIIVTEHDPDMWDESMRRVNLWLHVMYDISEGNSTNVGIEYVSKVQLDNLMIQNGMEFDKVTRRSSQASKGNYIMSWYKPDKGMSISQGTRKFQPVLNFIEKKVQLTGMDCYDIGCHTGGFSIALLQKNVRMIVGVDTCDKLPQHKQLIDTKKWKFVGKTDFRDYSYSEVDFICVDLYGVLVQDIMIPHLVGAAKRVFVVLLKLSNYAEMRGVECDDKFKSDYINMSMQMLQDIRPEAENIMHHSDTGKDEVWLISINHRVDGLKPIEEDIFFKVDSESDGDAVYDKKRNGVIPNILKPGREITTVGTTKPISTHNVGCFVCGRLTETARYVGKVNMWEGTYHCNGNSKDTKFEFKLDADEVTEFRTSLKAQILLATAEVKKLLEGVLKVIPKDIEIKRTVELSYILGPPGCGKTYTVLGMYRPGDLVVAPFSKLSPDYKRSLMNSKIEFRTFHNVVANQDQADTLYVDEYTSYPYELLVAAIVTSNANRVVLVGDAKQTRVHTEKGQGIYIGDKVPMHLLPTHICKVNRRNKQDVVNICRVLFGYDMESCPGKEGSSIQFIPTELADYAETESFKGEKMVFASETARDVFGIEETKGYSVKARQGSTYDNAILPITDRDTHLMRTRAFAIVAMTRHKERLAIVYNPANPNIMIFINKLKEACDYKLHVNTHFPAVEDGKKTVIIPSIDMPTPEKERNGPYDSYLHIIDILQNCKVPTIPYQEAINARSVQMPDYAVGAKYDMTRDGGVNSRGNPKQRPGKVYRIMEAGYGLSYDSSNLGQENQTITGRYKYPMPKKNMMVSRNLATQMVDKYYNDCKVTDMQETIRRELTEELIDMTIDEYMNDARDKHYFDRLYAHGKGIEFNETTVRFMLKNTFKPFNACKGDWVNKLQKPGQGISAWPLVVHAQGAIAFRIITKLDNLTDRADKSTSYTITQNGSVEEEYVIKLNEVMAEKPGFELAISDSPNFDITQNENTMCIEEDYYKRMFVPQWMLDQHFALRKMNKLMGDVITLDPEGKKASGAFDTLLGNNVLTKVSLHWIVEAKGLQTVSSTQGDDGMKMAVKLLINKKNEMALHEATNLQLVVQVIEKGEFCGYYIFRDRNRCFNLVPNILRTLVKIGGKDFRNYEEFTKYQVSLRDRTKFIRKLGVERTVMATAEFNNLNINVAWDVWHCINSFTHINEKQFLSIFKLMEKPQYIYAAKGVRGAPEVVLI